MKISKEQVAENRLRILDAAARMFRERGFEGVTVAEVMNAAGLTHGAFYGYFTSKDDLRQAVFPRFHKAGLVGFVGGLDVRIGRVGRVRLVERR